MEEWCDCGIRVNYCDIADIYLPITSHLRAFEVPGGSLKRALSLGKATLPGTDSIGRRTGRADLVD